MTLNVHVMDCGYKCSADLGLRNLIHTAAMRGFPKHNMLAFHVQWPEDLRTTAYVFSDTKSLRRHLPVSTPYSHKTYLSPLFSQSLTLLPSLFQKPNNMSA